jgi:hypothetical protein
VVRDSPGGNLLFAVLTVLPGAEQAKKVYWELAV